MKIFDLRPSPASTAADKSRRSFIWKLGAGASAALGSTAVAAKAASADGASLRAALLEAEKALRELHRDFERALDNGRFEDVVAMFADDAIVRFNGGIFSGRDRGVSRLYRERFRSGKTGKRIEPPPGFDLDAEALRDSIEVSADLKSAQAVFPYSIRVGRPIESDSSLASMARLHGEGVKTWWEGGVYEIRLVKEAADGRWQIGRLEYKTLSRADYRPGRSHAGPIDVSPLSTRYPEDPHGPDALV